MIIASFIYLLFNRSSFEDVEEMRMALPHMRLSGLFSRPLNTTDDFQTSSGVRRKTRLKIY